MAQIRSTAAFLKAIKTSDGTVVTPDANGDVTLGVATYVFIFGPSDDASRSVHVLTDATIVMSGMFLEWSNLPRNDEEQSVAQQACVTDYDTTAGLWVKDDSTVNAFVNNIGTGWTITNLSAAKTAGAGGAIWQVLGRGARRGRLNVVVTTGGKMRVATHGKSA